MNNIVLVGAGGTGMSGLAMMLFDIGYKNIVCINNIQTDLTDRLVRHGLKVIIGHGNYTIEIKDFIIYSDIQAIIDGPEITQSRIHQQSPTKKHFHICMTYNQFIAEISKRFVTVSITGSNGKTSTTAMAIWTLCNMPHPRSLSVPEEGGPQDYKHNVVGVTNPEILRRAKELRKNMTSHEILLWSYLKGDIFKGIKRRRQHPIANYILDFCCVEKKLIIELDGTIHNIKEQKEHDEIRDNYFKNRGFRIVRITNKQLHDNPNEAIQIIKNASNSPLPARRGVGVEATFALGIVGGLMPNFDHQGYAISSDTQIQSDIHHLFEHIFNQKHQLDYSLLKKYLFVIEACEHREHFLLYDSDYTLITNIQRDHTDYYHTRESYKEAFVHMIQKTRKQVFLTPSALDTLEGYQLPEVVVSDSFSFQTKYLIGKYLYSNASLLQKLLEHIFVIPTEVEESFINNNKRSLDYANASLEMTNRLTTILSQFQGVGRRMEYLGLLYNKPVYTDYSHHAPAIAGNMQALKIQFPDKKICAIFQPHQAQRVLVGRDDFKESLQDADTTLIYKLYTAREDFTTLQQEFPRLQSVQNFDELGVQFARELVGEYIIDTDDLKKSFGFLSDDYIIVIFSAGDLDEKMRALVY